MSKTPQIHTIRLQGPWNAKVLVFYRSQDADNGFDVEVGTERRCKLPSDWADWLGVAFRGRVAFDRNFNQPTQLDAEQKVWLVVEEVDFSAQIFLNDTLIGQVTLGDPPMRVDIRACLALSNRLRIEVDLPNEVLPLREHRSELAGGLIGSVRLEIEEPDS